jgi:hypothetical protein
MPSWILGRQQARGKRFPAELLTPEEIRALIRAYSARAPTGIRNHALIAVLYRGGLHLLTRSLTQKAPGHPQSPPKSLRGIGATNPVASSARRPGRA